MYNTNALILSWEIGFYDFVGESRIQIVQVLLLEMLWQKEDQLKPDHMVGLND